VERVPDGREAAVSAHMMTLLIAVMALPLVFTRSRGRQGSRLSWMSSLGAMPGQNGSLIATASRG
jgi:hypothetical protein